MSRDALAFVEEAIEAISLEMWRGCDPDHMERVEGPECTIVIELERIDSALGVKGTSMFAHMAEQVRQCAVALYAARDELRKAHP